MLLAAVAIVVAGAVGVATTYLVSIGNGTEHPVAGSASAGQTPTSPPPTPVLASENAGRPVPTVAGLARALRTALRDPRLGARIRANVVDVASGRMLLDRGAALPAAPASTAKLLTATAALATLPAQFRFTTSVLAGRSPGEVVLVGGGDPTLSTTRVPQYGGAARVSDLAAAVRRSGVRHVSRVLVDDGRYDGPLTAPGWDPDDVSGGYVAPITPAMVDGGRLRSGYTARSATPDLAAGTALAASLGSPHASVVRGAAPAGARRLGEVRSAPLSTLLSEMLTVSDNVLAECLARQVAIARGEPGSFAGAATAIRGALGRLGVPVAGVRLVDGSGLSRVDRLTARALTATLRVAATRPALRPLFSALPVAGYAGTLAKRYRTGRSHAAAGYVRAKTGTLTGVSTLAGVVTDADGRLLAFAFLADAVPATGTLAAEAALDGAAVSLAGCGCR